jgi:hypothetical protein
MASASSKCTTTPDHLPRARRPRRRALPDIIAQHFDASVRSRRLGGPRRSWRRRVIHLSKWLVAVAGLALRHLKRARLTTPHLFRAEVGIGLLALIAAGVGFAAVPVDTPNSTYVWAGCATFLLGVLVERIIQTAASRHRDAAEGMALSGEGALGAPAATGPVIEAEYTIVAATTEVIEPPRSVCETRLRVKATIEISGLAILAILLWLAHGPPVSANLRMADRSEAVPGAATATLGDEPERQAVTAVASPDATDGHAPEEAIEPFPRSRDGLWLAMDGYFDGAHSLDDIGSVFERRSGGIDLQMRFMSYQDLLRVGGSLREDLFARHPAAGRSTAARSTAWIKFRGPCWKRLARWPDGHRLEPWDIYDAAPGSGAEKNPWRAEIRQMLALCQGEVVSLGSPSPAPQ